MGLDGGLDLEGESEGLACLDGGDEWLGTVEDAVEEGLDLEAEGLAGGDWGLVEVEAGTGGWDGLGLGLGVDGDEEQVLAGVVDRDVLVGLEEAEFADALRGDAAGGEVGDAAGLELDAGVGDIHF